jgi:hypothetical protein
MLDVPVELDEHYDEVLLIQELFVNMRIELSWGEANVEFQKWIRNGGMNSPQLLEQAASLKVKESELQIEERQWRCERKLSWSRLITQFLLFPCVAIGIIAFLPISILTEKFVTNKVKDPLFKNSIRIAFKTFLGSLYTLILATVFSFIIPINFFIILVTLLGLGVLGVRGKMFWKTWMEYINFKSKISGNSDLALAYLKERNSLIQLIKTLHNETNK